MLHRPDAAYITQAGRCYMQVGNDELFELFQSGYSGAEYDEENLITQSDIAVMLSDTGKTALVGNKLRVIRQELSKRKWIGTLVDIIEKCAIEENGNETADSKEQRLFDELAKRKIDYPCSEYNVSRIRELKRIINIISNDYSDHASDEYIDAILAYSVQTKAKLPEKKEKTQLEAIVEYLAKTAAQNGYTYNLLLWLPVLPTSISVNQLNEYDNGEYFLNGSWKDSLEWKIEVPIGIYDDPVNQLQDTLYLNLSENGHHAVIGTVVSGKSTFMQTFIYMLCMKYTADWVNIYALDYSAKMAGSFAGMPQVGGVILENDDDKLSKFVNMIYAELNVRKELLKGGNYSQYVRANGVRLPAIIICIDNYSGFNSRTNGKYNDFILKISKEGVSYGIYLIVSAGGFNINEIPNRIGENIRTVICLELADKFQYGDAFHTMKIDTMPEVNIKGRGLAYVGESLLEFQTALCMDERDDFKRMEEIEKMAVTMSETWKGARAKTIPVIPQNPVWHEFIGREDVGDILADRRLLPVGYNAEDASPYCLDMSKYYCYTVGGKNRSGKTNMIKAILGGAIRMGAKITVIDYSGDLRTIANGKDVEFIDSDQGLFEFMLRLKDDFISRNKKKKEMDRKGVQDEEIFREMSKSFSRRIILMTSLTDFVLHVTKPDKLGPMNPFVENILEKGALHNVFWFAELNYDEVSRISGNRVYELFVKRRQGIHFGGNVASQRLFNFDYIPYMEQTKSCKPGIGLVPATDSDSGCRVVIPLVKEI